MSAAFARSPMISTQSYKLQGNRNVECSQKVIK